MEYFKILINIFLLIVNKIKNENIKIIELFNLDKGIKKLINKKKFARKKHDKNILIDKSNLISNMFNNLE